MNKFNFSFLTNSRYACRPNLYGTFGRQKKKKKLKVRHNIYILDNEYYNWSY